MVAAEEGGGRPEQSPDYEDELEEDDQEAPEDEADDSDGSSVDLEEAVARRKGGSFSPLRVLNSGCLQCRCHSAAEADASWP